MYDLFQTQYSFFSLILYFAATYTIQIFWRGDPGVENFVIRFPDEKTMKDWQDRISRQKRVLTDAARRSGQNGPSDTTFRWQQDQPQPENPYREREDDEDDHGSEATLVQGRSGFSNSRNASNSSLRSLGGQQPNQRIQHPRYPNHETGPGYQAPSLSVNTNIPKSAPSPGEAAGQSYFSPTNDSPNSVRSSSQASMYGFSRQGAPPPGWNYDNGKHRTAPAMPRAPSREGHAPSNRPSAPAGMSQYQQSQANQSQSRLRSASTPDMNGPGQRRQPNGQAYPPADPVPPIPNNVRMPVNRSQTASPPEGQLPIRGAPQSGMQPYENDDRLIRREEIEAPPKSAPRNAQMASPGIADKDILPTQLKVKVLFDPSPSHVTIVVPISIKYRTLVDRIDSKMSRVHPASIVRGTAKLKYQDETGDKIGIHTDEDVGLAIEEWATINESKLRQGVINDFELFWMAKPQ